MPEWAQWLLAALLLWVVVSILASSLVGRVLRLVTTRPPDGVEAEPALLRGVGPGHALGSAPGHPGDVPTSTPGGRSRRRVLVVDDEPALRLLLRTTLAADEFEVEEASSAEEAAELVRFWRPRLVILDVELPGMDGLTFCGQLKANPSLHSPAVLLLSGSDVSAEDARNAGADGLLGKPFSPLELVNVIDRVEHKTEELVAQAGEADTEQVLLYARDLSRLLEIERAQRRLLQHAYRQTVTALADALEVKDVATGLHALRVQRFAIEITEAVEPGLLDDPSLEYGFLLHDVGKIAVPDQVLNKPGPLTKEEFVLVERHPLIGAALLADVALLSGDGLRVVRSHHERWDGCGYPDRLAEQQIPLAARIFAVADALDAMTNDRAYRKAMSWDDAVDEILRESGRHFDPKVVSAFARCEQRLRTIHVELAANVA